jgi:hypothetical protein
MPLAIDLYAGLGGWTEGLLAEGWDVVGFGKPGYRGKGFNDEAIRRMRDGHKGDYHGADGWFGTYSGTKQGGDWFNAGQPSISRTCSSKSKARKAASAMIAKIPYPLACYIASVFKPMEVSHREQAWTRVATV